MTSLGSAIEDMRRDGEGWHAGVPDAWLQGRTAYGGFSAALALVAAKRCDEELPPLRSAQVSFVGPLSGDLRIVATRLRRGRNAAFVAVDVASEAGLGLRAVFVFMRAVDSAHAFDTAVAPAFPIPNADTRTFRGPAAVAFVQNFDLLDQREGLKPAEWLRWARLRERGDLDPEVELVAVADCLPPAALKPIGRPIPVSSVTWLLNLVRPAPATREGWWLLHADTDRLAGGASSQTMAIWDADGRQAAQQMQSVALFG